jgi:hypothetical protein
MRANAAQGAEIEELRAENARLQKDMDRVLEEAKKVCQENWDLRDKGAKDARRAEKAEQACEYFLGVIAMEAGKAERQSAYLCKEVARARELTGVEIREESPC